MRRFVALIIVVVLHSEVVCASSFHTELSRRSLDFFQQNSHPVTGLVRDRARNFGRTPNRGLYKVASIAATGFGLAVLSHAANSGVLDRAETEFKIIRTLQFIETKLFHWHGWLYHFVDWETGERAMNSEVSTIDTALFMAGAFYASAVFPESPLVKIVERLYARIDFNTMRTHSGEFPHKFTLSMGWTPEQGYIAYQWDIYSEHLILYLLGLAHPTRPLSPKSWLAWARKFGPAPTWNNVLGGGLPLFIHQYNFLFIHPEHIPITGVSLLNNTRKATQFDRATCVAAKSKSATYRSGYWGLSASDSPVGYAAFSPLWHNGTVCPSCAGASVMFQPELLVELESWAKGSESTQIFGKYGFVDAFNLEPRWFSDDVIGITVGALYLSLANTGENPIWPKFESLPIVARALKTVQAIESGSAK